MTDLTLYYYDADGNPAVLDTDTDHLALTAPFTVFNNTTGAPVGFTYAADAATDRFIPFHAVLAVDMPEGDKTLWQL